MIKLRRGPRPAKLTKERAKKLTQEFLLNNTSVWNIPYIKNALMQMSHGKCCYCEWNLKTGSNYMEVEHFHDKSQYPNEVVIWKNLLPSCKHCNVNKGEYDTKANDFINPSIDEPREHMVLVNSYIYKAKDNDMKGENTIRELKINDSERLCAPRRELLKIMDEKLDMMILCHQILKLSWSDEVQSNLQKMMRDLLGVCAPENPLSAVKTTFVLNSEKYKTIKKSMQEYNLWTTDMDKAEKQLERSRYDLEEVPI